MNHKVNIEAGISLDPEISKISLKSGDKVRGKPKFEMVDNLKNNDRDSPDKKVRQIISKKRFQEERTEVIQQVKYEDGTFKHLHCKNCENEWQYNTIHRLEDFFEIMEDGKSIRCLKCGSNSKPE